MDRFFVNKSLLGGSFFNSPMYQHCLNNQDYEKASTTFDSQYYPGLHQPIPHARSYSESCLKCDQMITAVDLTLQSQIA